MEVGFSDILDIVVMTILLYTVLVWFKQTRAAFVLTGILLLAGLYLLAQQFNLVLTTSVFQAFFAVILLALVVIFQEELRHFFERVAFLGLRTRFNKQKLVPFVREEIPMLVRTIADLAKERVGGLLVLRGKDLLLRHFEGGEELGGKLGEPILKSIFDPHSEGHDGAVVIEEDKISYFGAYLPLSKNLKEVGKGGTRHAAALGLSELTDCLCVIVSEERGSISIARHGELKPVADLEELGKILEKFYRELHPPAHANGVSSIFRKNPRQKIMAFGIAGALWFFQVYGSKVVYKTFTIPVEFAEIPAPLVLAEMDPKEVEVTLSGPRRAFYFLDRDKVHLQLKTFQIKEGVRMLRIAGSDVMVPENIVIENIEPSRVQIRLEPKP